MPALAAARAKPDNPTAHREFSSFRDPSGFLFWRDGTIYRWIDESYGAAFRHAQASGLYAKAVEAGLLLPFEVCDGMHHPAPGEAAREPLAVLKPVQLKLLTYPYEWSFGQLQDAAIATLDLHLLALDHGMLLKDASAFNIQFVDGAPRLIDHLSFDRLEDHAAWPAYGQFCRHFLSPLLLMSYVDLSMGRLLQIHLDGIPLDLASRLLPRRTSFSPGMQIHLHLHARVSRKYAAKRTRVLDSRRALSADRHRAIATSLKSLVKSLKPKDQITEWGDYYSDTNYTSDAFVTKKDIIVEFVKRTRPQTLWDLGGNNGEMSRAVRDLVDQILCVDIDPRAVDLNYRECRKAGITNIVPAIADLTNPTPALGLFNKERLSLFGRRPPDLLMALALIHHLAITNNVPLPYIAEIFGRQARTLIIEFVPKSDSQVQRLLANRQDIFPHYDEANFKQAFSEHFDIVDERPIPETDRVLYLMARKPAANAVVGE